MEATKSLNRLEAFSDGVFAIAITLLILEIQWPHAETEAGFWTRMGILWPSFLAFALSFFVILVTWITHHDLLRLVPESTRPLQLANGLALLYVTFIPFVTSVLADHLAGPDVNAAVAFYCGTFVFGSIAFNILVGTILHQRLHRSEADQKILRKVQRGYRIVFLIYAGTVLIAFALPYLALVINVAVRVYLLRLRYVHSVTKV